MGVLLEFYAVDPKQPEERRAEADFSLHIDPTALDDLSELMGVPALLDSLGRELGDSAQVVAPDWVRAVGTLPPVSAGALAQQWVRQFGSPDSTDAARAISALIALCRQATQQKWDVVFAWSE